MPRNIDADFREVRGGIRSKERVKDLAEVFTPERMVKAMLDLVGDASHAVETTFLEPACGNGNFLVEILARKCGTIRKRYLEDGSGRRVQIDILRAIATISAIDISPRNVEEARARMLDLTAALYEEILGQAPPDRYLSICAKIYERKIIVGDVLHRVGTLHDIRIGDDLSITCTPHRLEDILPPLASPVKKGLARSASRV